MLSIVLFSVLPRFLLSYKYYNPCLACEPITDTHLYDYRDPVSSLVYPWLNISYTQDNINYVKIEHEGTELLYNFGSFNNFCPSYRQQAYRGVACPLEHMGVCLLDNKLPCPLSSNSLFSMYCAVPHQNITIFVELSDHNFIESITDDFLREKQMSGTVLSMASSRNSAFYFKPGAHSQYEYHTSMSYRVWQPFYSQYASGQSCNVALWKFSKCIRSYMCTVYPEETLVVKGPVKYTVEDLVGLDTIDWTIPFAGGLVYTPKGSSTPIFTTRYYLGLAVEYTITAKRFPAVENILKALGKLAVFQWTRKQPLYGIYGWQCFESTDSCYGGKNAINMLELYENMRYAYFLRDVYGEWPLFTYAINNMEKLAQTYSTNSGCYDLVDSAGKHVSNSRSVLATAECFVRGYIPQSVFGSLLDLAYRDGMLFKEWPPWSQTELELSKERGYIGKTAFLTMLGNKKITIPPNIRSLFSAVGELTMDMGTFDTEFFVYANAIGMHFEAFFKNSAYASFYPRTQDVALLDPQNINNPECGHVTHISPHVWFSLHNGTVVQKAFDCSDILKTITKNIRVLCIQDDRWLNTFLCVNTESINGYIKRSRGLKSLVVLPVWPFGAIALSTKKPFSGPGIVLHNNLIASYIPPGRNITHAEPGGVVTQVTRRAPTSGCIAYMWPTSTTVLIPHFVRCDESAVPGTFVLLPDLNWYVV
ncbi:ORF67-like protein [Bufonid herpesvirus 1]|uniref:ORF67-like protein n=1 Tax=Bufonid herpesvirus 1 TaxID=2282206 RepID=UPI000EB684A9|nr:ORF67-like protein [Bufonid herpesvirus 1]AXF48572.1 ORF67-like protein [Bufonid herpesvirus 1]